MNVSDAKKNFKYGVKDFLSHHVDVKPDDVWTLDLVAEATATKYDKETRFVEEDS